MGRAGRAGGGEVSAFLCALFGLGFYFGTVGDSTISIIGGGAAMALSTYRLFVLALTEEK